MAPHSLAEQARLSEESISFDPKKTDDLLEKIDLINKSYAYTRNARRDPFAPYLKSRELLQRELLGRESSWEHLCDANYDASKPLSRLDLAAMELKGVVWGGLGIEALMKTPDGKSYNVRMGDLVGRNCGKVVKITNKYVKVEEKYKNPAGRVRIDYKYKVLKRQEKGEKGKKGGSPEELEPGAPTETVTVDVDAEDKTLVAAKNDLKKLADGEEQALRRVKMLMLGPGDFEAVIVGGAFNIDLPKSTRFKSRVTIYIPAAKDQPSQSLGVGLDGEFTTMDLAEIASLGQRVRFSLKELTPVYLFLSGIHYNTGGVVSVTVSRLLSLEEVQAVRQLMRGAPGPRPVESREGAPATR